MFDITGSRIKYRLGRPGDSALDNARLYVVLDAALEVARLEAPPLGVVVTCGKKRKKEPTQFATPNRGSAWITFRHRVAQCRTHGWGHEGDSAGGSNAGGNGEKPCPSHCTAALLDLPGPDVVRLEAVVRRKHGLLCHHAGPRYLDLERGLGPDPFALEQKARLFPTGPAHDLKARIGRNIGPQEPRRITYPLSIDTKTSTVDRRHSGRYSKPS